MKILITGGKGFIGSHLVESLSKKHAIKIFDLKEGKDVRNFELLLEEAKDVEAIIHLAALCKASESIEIPLEYFSTNIIGTANVLEVARRLGIKKVIHASSAAISSLTPYGISKKHAEELCKLYIKLYKMNVIILRIFNVYGERNDKGVIKEFLERIKNNLPLIVHGDGNFVRDYIHVKDVVKAIEIFIDNDYPSGIYEIGTGVGTSVNELVEMLKEITKRKIEVKHVKSEKWIIKKSVASKPFLSKTVNLKDGIKEIWESMKNGS